MLTAFSAALRLSSTRFILQEVFVWCGYRYTEQCHNGNEIIPKNEHEGRVAFLKYVSC